jgi:DNA-binding CsgD family transcriptional regulator
MKDSTAEILELLRDGDPAALAVDEAHRVVFWNPPAERLLGRSMTHALGRKCHDLLGGRDPFGNRFCYPNCPVTHTAARGEAVLPFEVDVLGAAGAKLLLNVTTLRVGGREPGSALLVHLLQPIDERSRLARLLARLGTPVSMTPLAAVLPFRVCEGPAAVDSSLTEREREVLGCVVAGLPNKEIALTLDISVATARNHIHRILEKLGVHSRLEALSLCVRRGWAESLPRPAEIAQAPRSA